MCDDFTVIQSLYLVRAEPRRRRSGLVQTSVGRGAQPLSKRRVVPILQGQTGTDSRPLRRVRALVHKGVEDPEHVHAVSSCVLLGVDVGSLRDAAVERSGEIREQARRPFQLVAHHLPVPESDDPSHAKTVAHERGQADDRQPDDAGARLQAAHRRQVLADGEVCSQEDGALLRAEEELDSARIRAHVRMESDANNRQTARLVDEHIQKSGGGGEAVLGGAVSVIG